MNLFTQGRSIRQAASKFTSWNRMPEDQSSAYNRIDERRINGPIICLVVAAPMRLYVGKRRSGPGNQPLHVGLDFLWLQRLSRSLSRFETQDIKTQPQFNHYSLGKAESCGCEWAGKNLLSGRPGRQEEGANRPLSSHAGPSVKCWPVMRMMVVER